MKLKRIEGVKRKLRKAIVLTDALDISFDNNTHFKVHSETSKETIACFSLVFPTYIQRCTQIYPLHNWPFKITLMMCNSLRKAFCINSGFLKNVVLRTKNKISAPKTIMK